MSEQTINKPSIIIDGVKKRFTLNHAFSLKDTVVSWIKRRQLTSQFEALKGVDLVIGEGESVAILGLNGSGKSTLLKLVSGVMEPDEGQVLTRGRVAGLIEVGAGFHPELTGRENVFLNAAILGMKQHEIEARYDDIVAFSEIEQFIDQEVKHYSSGMFMRLAFSVAIHVELDVLLVDEILSVGDAPFREKCRLKFEELISRGKTLVVVTHDMEMVRELCVRGVVINKGKLIYDGEIEGAIKLVDK
ncbi:ABC transporter ATP-binding protein [Microbacterium sp. A93]|uniref:ABC transporter ATP-binding protein n=1 Tax=Microbacterium sp. A93 TaxID=3450716 RepID=UPI003F4352F4